MRRILAFDPGTRAVGYAVLDADGSGVTLRDCGTLRPRGLADIHAQAVRLVRRHRPVAVVVERAFLGVNPRTLMRLSEARAALLLAAAKAPTAEYSPAEVKRAVTAHGGATKTQVQRSVAALFRLKSAPASDAADAVALGLCHIYATR